MLNINMTLHKRTPNKFRYKAEDEDSPIGDIYVLRSAFKGAPPEAINVTVRNVA